MRACVCVSFCAVCADKSGPKRQYSEEDEEEEEWSVLPFCRLIAQVVTREKKNDDRYFCRRCLSKGIPP